MPGETVGAVYSLVKKEIKVHKKGANHKLLQCRAPKCLWDDCLELEAYIRFNTAYDIYKLDWEVPKTVMSGKTSDISQLQTRV